jgi:hypothetical protein
MAPAWILDIFAAVMLAVSAVSCARLAAARPWSRRAGDADIDAAHVLTGLAMAGMLASGLRTLPDGAWAVVFAVVTVWLGWRVAAEGRQRRLKSLGAGHHLPHLLHSAAMVYMFLAVTRPAPAAGAAVTGMAASAGTGLLRLPTLGLGFVLLIAGWAVWDLDQLSARMPARTAVARGQRPASRRPVLAAAGLGREWPGAAGAVSATAGVLPAGRLAARGPAADAVPAASGSPAASARRAGQHLLDPRIATASRIAMGITMTLMLVLMI